MRRRLLTGIFATALCTIAVGCSDEAGLVLVFPDQAARDSAYSISIWAFQSNGTNRCPDFLATGPGQLFPNDAHGLPIEVASEDVPFTMLPKLAVSFGQRTVLVKLKDSPTAQQSYLQGCATGQIPGTLRVELQRRESPDMSEPDAGPDMQPDLAPEPRFIALRVQELRDAARMITGTIYVKDRMGHAISQPFTDANAASLTNVDVTGFVPPFDVTAVAEAAGAVPPHHGGATVLGALTAASFIGAPLTAQMRVPIELDPPPTATPFTVTAPAGPTYGPLYVTPTVDAVNTLDITSGTVGNPINGINNATYSVGVLRTSTMPQALGLGSATANNMTHPLGPGDFTDLNTTITVTTDITAITTPTSSGYAFKVQNSTNGAVIPIFNKALPVANPEMFAAINGFIVIAELFAENTSRRSEQRVVINGLTSTSLTLPTAPTATLAPASATVGAGFTVTMTDVFAEAKVLHVKLTGTGTYKSIWHVISAETGSALPLTDLPTNSPLEAGTVYTVEAEAAQLGAMIDVPGQLGADYSQLLRAGSVTGPTLRLARHTQTLMVN